MALKLMMMNWSEQDIDTGKHVPVVACRRWRTPVARCKQVCWFLIQLSWTRASNCAREFVSIGCRMLDSAGRFKSWVIYLAPRTPFVGNFVYIVRCIYDWCSRAGGPFASFVSVRLQTSFRYFQHWILNLNRVLAQRLLKLKQQLVEVCVGFNNKLADASCLALNIPQYTVWKWIDVKRTSDGPVEVWSVLRKAEFPAIFKSDESMNIGSVGSGIFVFRHEIGQRWNFQSILFLTPEFHGIQVRIRPYSFPNSEHSNEFEYENITGEAKRIIIIRLNRDGIRCLLPFHKLVIALGNFVLCRRIAEWKWWKERRGRKDSDFQWQNERNSFCFFLSSDFPKTLPSCLFGSDRSMIEMESVEVK